MSRRLVFAIVLALSGLVLVAVVGAIVFSLLDSDGAFGLIGNVEDEIVAYFTVFGLVFADAIVPIFPGETTLTTASVAASDGKLQLELVILAGAIGAVLGDSALYWIARTGPRRLKARLNDWREKDERVAKGLALLGRAGPLLIACGRFIPGVRFAVNVSMGLTEYPYRRFLLWSAVGGVGWAVYTCVLAYFVSTALADFPLGSIVVSGFLTTLLVAAVYWIDRRRDGSETPGPGSPAAAPEARGG